MLLALFAACADPVVPNKGASADSTDTNSSATCGTWRDVGQPFTLTYCTGCHATGREGGARHGATDGVNFDSLAGVQAAAPAMMERLGEGGDMPPGGGPTAPERARLLKWLACGAPGDEATLPAFDTPPVRDSDDGRADVWSDGAEVMVEHGVDFHLQSREWFRVSTSLALFTRWERYDEDGNVVRGERWDPPLPIWTVSGDAAEFDTVGTIVEDGSSRTSDERWSIQQEEAVEVDGRAQDQFPQESVATEGSGEEWGWQYSDDAGSVSSWHSRGDNFQKFLRQECAPPPLADTPFPVKPGTTWPERIVATVELP